MIKQTYRCKLLTDVVISAQTATEGNHRSLDYMPGAIFMGLVAKDYESLKNKDLANKTFHGVDVQFGDAHLVIDDLRSFKLPLAWHKPKLGGNEIYVHHSIDDNLKEQLRKDKVQLKQQREGFFIVKNDTIKRAELHKMYYQKSAQDREKRRSADEKMFGYEALPAGTTWVFDVLLADEGIKETIKTKLVGKHRIGRSRNAQFGEVEIDFKTEEANDNKLSVSGKTIALYADSNLCFFNLYGYPTLTPNAEQFGLTNGWSIDWDKSQVRSFTYASWNAKRQCRDADRVCIAKGSVIIATRQDCTPTELVIKSVGAYTNEGFGRLLINPSFLQSNNGIINLEEEKFTITPTIQYPKIDKCEDGERLIKKLNELKTKNEKEVLIMCSVEEFRNNYKSIFREITPSQWGGIRDAANKSKNYETLKRNLFGTGSGSTTHGYLTHGVNKDKWERFGRINILARELDKVNKENDAIEFTILLAATMAKYGSKA